MPDNPESINRHGDELNSPTQLRTESPEMSQESAQRPATHGLEPVRVATEPAANAPTYAEVVADAEITGKPWIDDTTPAGHFGVTVRNIGGVGCYWFRGKLGDPNARVVARTQNGNHYIGGGILGGEWVSR